MLLALRNPYRYKFIFMNIGQLTGSHNKIRQISSYNCPKKTSYIYM